MKKFLMPLAVMICVAVAGIGLAGCGASDGKTDVKVTLGNNIPNVAGSYSQTKLATPAQYNKNIGEQLKIDVKVSGNLEKLVSLGYVDKVVTPGTYAYNGSEVVFGQTVLDLNNVSDVLIDETHIEALLELGLIITQELGSPTYNDGWIYATAVEDYVAYNTFWTNRSWFQIPNNNYKLKNLFPSEPTRSHNWLGYEQFNAMADNELVCLTTAYLYDLPSDFPVASRQEAMDDETLYIYEKSQIANYVVEYDGYVTFIENSDYAYIFKFAEDTRVTAENASFFESVGWITQVTAPVAEYYGTVNGWENTKISLDNTNVNYHIYIDITADNCESLANAGFITRIENGEDAMPEHTVTIELFSNGTAKVNGANTVYTICDNTQVPTIAIVINNEIVYGEIVGNKLFIEIGGISYILEM